MQFEAITAGMRSGADRLSAAASRAHGLASSVDERGGAVVGAVEEAGVASAAGRALAAVAAQVEVCAGGIEYAAAQVRESAADYDRVDVEAATRLPEVEGAR